MKALLATATALLAITAVAVLYTFHSQQQYAYDPVPYVKNLDYNEFAGLWYLIASKPNAIERGCKCAQSFNSQKSALHFDLAESCVILGKNVTSKSYVLSDAPGLGNFTNWNGPISAPYWVMETDILYRWMVIGQPSKKGFWIQSRTLDLGDDIIESLIQKYTTKYGFDLSDLEKENQDCPRTVMVE